MTAISSTSRANQVREQIRAAVESGEYAPGERLPSERELVDLFGVSRVSVREAIRSLEAVGLVEVHHGRGCFVAATATDQYAASFGHWLDVHRDEVLDLLLVRGALDELAAECAARRNEQVDIPELRELNADFAGDGSDVGRLVSDDVAFHNAVARSSGSVLLADLLADLHESFNESRRVTLALPGWSARSAGDHEAIIAAIERGDPVAARTAVSEHIQAVRDSLNGPLEHNETEEEA